MLGKCTEYPSTVGAGCAESLQCDGGLWCDQTNWQCAARKPANDACNSSNECNYGLFCDAEITGTVPGKCTAPQNNGTVCERESHCSSGICAANASSINLCMAYDNCYN
jgi:hypothetical protein